MALLRVFNKDSGSYWLYPRAQFCIWGVEGRKDRGLLPDTTKHGCWRHQAVMERDWWLHKCIAIEEEYSEEQENKYASEAKKRRVERERSTAEKLTALSTPPLPVEIWWKIAEEASCPDAVENIAAAIGGIETRKKQSMKRKATTRKSTP